MRSKSVAVAVSLLISASIQAQPAPDTATRFGTRESVSGMQLSPDGTRVSYLAPMKGQGSAVVVSPVDSPDKPRIVSVADGNPNRFSSCAWVSNSRLACQVYGVTRTVDIAEPHYRSRLVSVGVEGGDAKVLSFRENFYSRGLQLYGGSVIDWLPDETEQLLMTRVYLPDDRTGTRLGSASEGLGVDRMDSRTAKSVPVEYPRPDATEYISDGRGTVRIMGIAQPRGADQMDTGITTYLYRTKGSRNWLKLGDFDSQADTGFNPFAVDPDLDVAYGFRKLDGRWALYRVKLDGSRAEELVYAHPTVDVDDLIRIGPRNRVVGATYVTDVRNQVIFDPDIKKVMAGLTKALSSRPLLRIVDSSVDERKLLIWSGADNDPGVHYIFDRDTRELRTFLVSRPELEGQTLATVKPITYPAADGTMIPAYLTVPPGKDPRSLPAIVLPHGGPSARDEWGFDWLSQYYAAMGYAVLQPNFRGSAGYGDKWFEDNGYRSWKVAIGDVNDAGRWLVKEGIADPTKLAIVGWSYGGYAALQSAVTDPGLFKAVVAIAPVTDLALLKDQARNWTNYRLRADFIGTGPHISEGSPAQNAARIQVPVMLVHGDMDRNVWIQHSKLMDERLRDAGKSHSLLQFPELDHYLDDSEARIRMLRESESFLRQSLGN